MVRDGDARSALEPDPVRLNEWIGDRLGGGGAALTLSRLGAESGIANALYLVRLDDEEWVLRRPPAVKNDPSASDTGREWRILNALERSFVPHPRPLLWSDDPEVIGAPFLIMERVHGFTPGFELPTAFGDGEARRSLAMAYVDGIADLSEVDWRARGLTDLGKPEGFLGRQVGRWLGQLERYRTRDLPELGFVSGWLEANRPPMSRPALIHGDYSPFNVMVAPDRPVRLAAIVDWDTGTIGDPLLDLGHLLARWYEPNEEPVLGVPPGGTHEWPRRAALLSRYRQQTGRDVDAISYYECLALFKLAVILEGTYARQRRTGMSDDQNSMTELVPRLLRAAAEFARGRRISGA
jgi:aminoglycoside phosphotransferase (APT) family kinase protein